MTNDGPHLTTPHGDQKRKHFGFARLALGFLTTPHGDQKPLDMSRSRRRRQRSLPLMGIRNRGAPSWPTPRFTLCSLPLMGIRNSRSASVRRLRPSISLPLMGIRNTPRPVVVHPARELTTPHGDQKPWAGLCLTCPKSTTHYPSWGSETSAPPPDVVLDRSSHYPSWGSETSERIGLSVGPDSVALTTPHGDQKQARRGLPTMDLEAHYPSWGSETIRLLRSIDQSLRNSLPLMGIRNHYVRQRLAERIGNSLPLMGIRNKAPSG